VKPLAVLAESAGDPELDRGVGVFMTRPDPKAASINRAQRVAERAAQARFRRA
jgi:hypothetical protein